MSFFIFIFSSLHFLLQNLGYTHNTQFHIEKIILYAINNVLNENIIIILFCYCCCCCCCYYYYYESKKLECQVKIYRKIIRIKKTKKKIVNADNNEENVYEKVIL